jgi:hypothetical protein
MRNLLSEYLSATSKGTPVRKAYRSDLVRGLGRNVQSRRPSTNANRINEKKSLANAIDQLQLLIMQALIQRGVVSKGVKYQLPARVLVDVDSLRRDLRDMMKTYENVQRLTAANVRKLTKSRATK